MSPEGRVLPHGLPGEIVSRSPASPPGAPISGCSTSRTEACAASRAAPAGTPRPDWSPVGERVAFARAAARRSSIWVVGVDGAPASRLDDTDGLADPDWARTDRALAPRPDERLPDLDQRAPGGVVVVQAGRGFRLGFASSTENRGSGPLVIHGFRLVGQSMRADQIVELRGGATRVVSDVGSLHFEPHAPHHHWHLESFVSYELRRAGDFELTVRDRKSGFCLIDRWGHVAPRIPGSGPPRFVGDCESGQPDARRVVQGTSVGYVDRYPAFFHGQQLDLTGLPAGRDVLVHRADPYRAMRELTYSDDTASVLLQLTRPTAGHRLRESWSRPLRSERALPAVMRPRPTAARDARAFGACRSRAPPAGTATSESPPGSESRGRGGLRA